MSSYFLGIDPGVSGALALIRDDNFVMLSDDFESFSKHYQQLKGYQINLSFLENVWIMPGAASKSSTTFMKNAGGWEALLSILGIKHMLDTPQTWQKEILGVIPKAITKGLEKKEADRVKREHKKKIKEKSVQEANRFFGLDLKNTEDGKADALNMARFAMKYFHNKV